jgi:hypothetical protein
VRLVKRWIIGYPGRHGDAQNDVLYASSQDAALAQAENLTRAGGWDVEEARAMGDTWAEPYGQDLAYDLGLADQPSTFTRLA